MHEKVKFSKIKGGICNISIEVAYIYNISPRPTVSNWLIAIKLKKNLKYRGHLYFEPVCLLTAYRTLNCLESYNNFSEDISIKSHSSEDIFKLFDIVEIWGQSECLTKKMFLMEKNN